VLSVQTEGGCHIVRDRGDVLTTAATPQAVLDAVFARVHRRAFELAALAGWVRVHGAVLRIAGARIVVVGPAGSGKTTLALAALAAGEEAEADESFVVRRGVVVAVPRRFHVKPGSADVVPGAADWIRQAPLLDGDPPLRLLDPSDVGLRWHLPEGPVEHVVLIDRVSGPSALDPASATGAAPEVLAQVFPTVESRSTVVREVAGLLRGVGVHRLRIGTDGSALRWLDVVARGAPDR
jgi:HPr kinase/phosphorylase